MVMKFLWWVSACLKSTVGYTHTFSIENIQFRIHAHLCSASGDTKCANLSPSIHAKE